MALVYLLYEVSIYSTFEKWCLEIVALQQCSLGSARKLARAGINNQEPRHGRIVALSRSRALTHRFLLGISTRSVRFVVTGV